MKTKSWEDIMRDVKTKEHNHKKMLAKRGRDEFRKKCHHR